MAEGTAPLPPGGPAWESAVFLGTAVFPILPFFLDALPPLAPQEMPPFTALAAANELGEASVGLLVLIRPPLLPVS